MRWFERVSHGTSSIKGDSLANWDEDEELNILDPFKEALPKPDTK
jgi:hypothetical protein